MLDNYDAAKPGLGLLNKAIQAIGLAAESQSVDETSPQQLVRAPLPEGLTKTQRFVAHVLSEGGDGIRAVGLLIRSTAVALAIVLIAIAIVWQTLH